MSRSTTDLIRTALVTGGGGGIGKAISQYLISKGKKVIVVGRTEKKVQETAKEIGAAAYYTLDTGDIKSIPAFVQKVTAEHPDLNCLINNAGVQQPFELPGSGGQEYPFDLKKADQEIDINIRGPLHLIVELLPHFTASTSSSSSSTLSHAVILNVSSVLGFLPGSIINPVYNGTKAWVHAFTLNLRTQFQNGPNRDRIKIVELVPPTVATDLHRERVDPDDNKKSKSKESLSLEEFMDEVARGLETGDDTISAGPGKQVVKLWHDALGQKYEQSTK